MSESSSELLNFEGVKDKIRDKVKTTFFELLPEEGFNKMIEEEIKDFFEATVSTFELTQHSSRNGGYSSDKTFTVTPISPFRALVWGEVRKLIDPTLMKFFSSEGWIGNRVWDLGGEGAFVSLKMEEKLEQLALKMAASMFKNMFIQAFQQSRQDVVDIVKSVHPSY